MNRWSKPLNFFIRAPFKLLGAFVFALAACLVGNTAAQAQIRNFPPDVVRAAITFVAPPQVLVNQQSEFLAPGVRVRNEHNLLALTGSLHGKTFLVNYQRDPAGLIRDIWILTPEEAGASRASSPGADAPFLGG